MVATSRQDGRSAVDLAQHVIDTATARLVELGGVDANQTLAYEVAHAAAATRVARCALDYAELGELEARLAGAFVADAVCDLAS